MVESMSNSRRSGLGIVLDALLFIGPSYVANAAPLLVGGGTPLEGGKNFLGGQRILGAHKTVRGLFAGIIAGSLIGLAESPVDSHLLLGGILIALGTVLGDLVGAFLKRRIRIKPGSQLTIFDQLYFVFGGLLLVQVLFN